jgi:signal transduction histidine kinase
MLGSLRRLQFPRAALTRQPLGRLVVRAADLLRGFAAERQVVLELRVDDDLVVDADEDHAIQLFANLIKNGAEAAGSDGRVAVVARQSGAEVCCEVSDTGRGVPAHLVPTLFTPWHTSKDQGLGLGLAIAHRLARGMSWDITYRRHEARTVFEITIPRGRGDLP